MSCWPRGSSWSDTSRCTPVDNPASRRPGDGLHQQPPPLGLRRLGGHGPRDSMIPRGNAMSVCPPHRAALNQSRLRATTPPPTSCGHGSTSSRRRGASSTRNWPFFTKI
jgi:hypothetical protein